MDDATTPKGQRPRLTCTECNRRKIRCDKNVPCASCAKRGHPELCTREETTALGAPPAYRARAESEASSDLVRALLDRVGQLEAKLQEQAGAAPEPLIQHSPEDQSNAMDPRPNGTPQSPIEESIVVPTVDKEDAATVLEFMAWGRQKDTVYGTSPEHHCGPRRPESRQGHDDSALKIIFESNKTAQLDLLEALLPSKHQLMKLVEYHNSDLCWYHCSYSPTIFRAEMNEFLHAFDGDIRHEELETQWLALLFAVLTGTITCAPSSICQSWGISESERSALALRWYEATVSCLNIGEYTEVHTIHSVQAIATLTIAAHTIGRSHSQSVLLASAGRIAQSLGLHRLSSENKDTSLEDLRRRESGRRVFNQLCTQDWFQIPFSDSYSLNPRFINTAKPLNCNDDDMVIQPPSIPTQASYSNYRYEIARLMPELLDAMQGCNTLMTKYQQVLEYDDRMRKLATAYMPTFLLTNAPVQSDWPNYIGWARRSLAICASHKIIMIHRKFLGLSFTNTAFSFTRRTCIAAAKTILKEALSTSDEQGPVLWIEQAFAIAAAIILSLDITHRAVSEQEYNEHSQLVADTINYLENYEHSKIASRGVQLLSTLQRHCRKNHVGSSRKRSERAAGHSSVSGPNKRARTLNNNNFMASASRSLTENSLNISLLEEPQQPSDAAWHSLLLDGFQAQTGTAGQNLFDDLLSFQY